VINKNDGKRPLMDFLSAKDDQNPVESMKLEEMRDIVADCIELLPEKEKLVVSLYYYDELTMKEIGSVLKLTESRVSQIHTKAVMRLRGKLRRTLEGN